MKPINTLITILFISLLSSPSWSVTLGDLVERDGLYYEKFTDVPFTGEITGQFQGSIKNGKEEGAWVRYHKNGQLMVKANFENGKEQGAFVSYRDNGQLKNKGNYKNGKEEGAWVWYYDNGQVNDKRSYKNGKKEGAWVGYYENGQLRFEGHYKNGKKEGDWDGYNKDGTVDKERTGTFKDGVKISD